MIPLLFIFLYIWMTEGEDEAMKFAGAVAYITLALIALIAVIILGVVLL